MAGFFDQAPIYQERPNSSIRDLILMQGEQRARMAQQAGQNWANAISGVGNAVAGGIQEYQAQKAEKQRQAQMAARDAATANVIQNWNGDDKDLLANLVKIRGPKEGTQMAETISKFTKNGADNNPESHLKTTHAMLGTFLGESPELQAAGWPQMKAGLQPTIQKLGLPVQLPDQYSPDVPQMLGSAHKAIGETLGLKDAVPRGTKLTVAGPDGKPMERLVSDEELAKGVPTYVAPEKPAKAPEVGSFQDYVVKKFGAEATPAQIEAARKSYAVADNVGGGAQSATNDDAKAIAEAVMRGEQPPDLKALYKMGAPVKAILAKSGYNLAAAQTDWAATQRHMATMNGPAQTRMGQAIETSSHALDKIDELAQQWDAGKFPLLNRVQLAAAKSGSFGPKAQSIANQLEAQITDVTSELGQVYMGGNSPTDHALGLAQKNLSADWSRDTLLDMTKLARTNLQIRANSMKNSGVIGASANNPYAPQAAPAPAAAPVSSGLPRAGTKAEYDALPAGSMYVGSDGQVRKKG